jgi:hypothetical protein
MTDHYANFEPVAPVSASDLNEWADYFQNFDATVGAPALTGQLVADLLRGPRPFGAYGTEVLL